MWVRVDRKYELPKLEENTRRLDALRARLQKRMNARNRGGRLVSNGPHPGWQHVQDHLKQVNSDFVQYESGGALTLELDDEDWQLEITPAGLFICQAGYALEDMQSLLSDGTAEDLGSDELAKQAKVLHSTSRVEIS